MRLFDGGNAAALDDPTVTLVISNVLDSRDAVRLRKDIRPIFELRLSGVTSDK